MSPHDYPRLLAVEAFKGDEKAAADLIRLAVAASKYIELVCQKQPSLVKKIAPQAARFGFPVLRSPIPVQNKRREKMVDQLGLAALQPFRTEGIVQDDTYEEIIEMMDALHLELIFRRREIKPFSKANARWWAECVAKFLCAGTKSLYGSFRIPRSVISRAQSSVEKRKEKRRATLERQKADYKKKSFAKGKALRDEAAAFDWEKREAEIEAMVYSPAELEAACVEILSIRLKSLFRD